MFYQFETLETLRADCRRARLMVVVALVFLLCVLAFLFANRLMVATMAVSILAGAGLIFFADVKLRPLFAYRTYMERVFAMAGKRFAEGRFVRVSHDEGKMDGVLCKSVMIHQAGVERLFYLDAELELPAYVENQPVRFELFDKFIIGAVDIADITDEKLLALEREKGLR